MEALVPLVFGALVALLAVNRGRSGIAWFLLGALFNCFALIVLLVLPDLKVEEARHQRLEQENRRLRERAAKDRHVADQRHAETSRRLTAHDRALGVDTSGALDISEPAPMLAPPAPPPFPAPPAGEWTRAEWHYVEDGRAVGPIDFDTLRRLWRAGDIGGATLVWTELFDEDWHALRAVPALEEALRA